MGKDKSPSRRAATSENVSERLLAARALRHRQRYGDKCVTCNMPGAVASIRSSLAAMVKDPLRHRGLTLVDVRTVMEQETGASVNYNTFCQHVRNHEPELYAAWLRVRSE